MILTKYKEQIDKELEDFFKKRLERANNIAASSKEAIQNLKNFTLKGKRIRPILVILGYKAFNGKNEKEIIKAAIAVELMQSFLLIHDDIIDKDNLRRGSPTIHKLYKKKYNLHFGESMAIVLGDICSVLGSEAILQTNFPEKYKLRAIDKFNKVIINTCFGQLLDIESTINKEINKDNILKIHNLKTAIYTIEGPLHIGAILAGAKQKELKILSNYAIPLGQAFQLKDDVLGLFGTEEKIGKPVGSDLKEGKKTLLILKALEKTNNEEKNFIKNCLGNRKINKEEIEKIKQIVIKTGSLAYSDALAKSLAEKAKKAIINSKIKYKQPSLEIADYMVNRNS